MPDLHYINSKLVDAIYTLTVHEGDARRRLIAAYFEKLKRLNPKSFPPDLVKDFKWVKETIERGRTKFKIDGVVESGLPHIRNSTASKVIKKLLYIQNKIDGQLNEEFNR